MMDKRIKLILTSLVIIGIVGLVLSLATRYLLINTRASVVNPDRYLRNHGNLQDIYAQTASNVFYSPLQADIAPMDSLILVDIADDPVYSSIELQVFDDERGQGARVLLYPHAGPVDAYATQGDFIDPAETPNNYVAADMQYSLAFSETGVTASLRMLDKNGTSIEFDLKEEPHKKPSEGFLAPIGGGSAVQFDYFPFFHMQNMNFVRRSGTELFIRIGGEARTPARIPIPANWEWVYLSRYTPSPILGRWSPAYNGELPALEPAQDLTCQSDQTRYELVDNDGHFEIRRLTAFNEQHTIHFDFAPPIPDLPALKDGTEIDGRFVGGAGDTAGIIAGEYHIQRSGETIAMQTRPLKGWQPNPGALWVTTWAWEGVITVGAEDSVTLNSGWIRTE